MKTLLDENILIAQAKKGDLDAFNIIILHYQDFLFRVALRIMYDEDDAADALQEACLLAFRRLNTYRDGSFRGWLARITSNVCFDALRYQNRHRTQSFDANGRDDNDETAPSAWLADPAGNPEKQVESREFIDVIQHCLATISPQYQMVLVLIDIEDFSYEEAAEALNIPVGTIKSRLARARMQMKAMLRSLKDILPSRYYSHLSLSILGCR